MGFPRHSHPNLHAREIIVVIVVGVFIVVMDENAENNEDDENDENGYEKEISDKYRRGNQC